MDLVWNRLLVAPEKDVLQGYWDLIYPDAPGHARSRQTGLERKRLDQRRRSWRTKYCHDVLIVLE
jgi:hypothetical protein